VNNTMLQVVLQAVSALAVAGGLVYAALQFRGWRTAQYVANFTTLVELQLQLRQMVVEESTLAPLSESRNLRMASRPLSVSMPGLSSSPSSA